FQGEVEKRLGYAVGRAQKFAFERSGDPPPGWIKGDDGTWHYLLFVENGRARDLPGRRLLSGLAAIAADHDGEFSIATTQNLLISGVRPERKARIEALLAEYGLDTPVGA